ncbi:MAG: CoA transferase, partial [Chloroflexi bacterium]|nr:CoA transferase [Chloroflexota bacterium]
MTSTLPLAGLTVIEVGDFIALPYAGKLLRDLGARVIKVEPPTGDTARRYGPFPSDRPDREQAGLFRYLNGGKLGVTLNLATPTGRQLLRELAATADLVFHELRASQAEAWQLTYADLAAANPRLIVTALTPFGSTGPYRDFRGNDLINWHAAAVGHRYLGEPGRAPLRAAWYHSDHFAAATAAMGALLAVEVREVTGRGQFVDVSNVEAMAVPLVAAAELSLYHQGGELGYRTGRLGLKGAPLGLLRCRDGWVFFYVLQADQWRRLVEVMGSPEWA